MGVSGGRGRLAPGGMACGRGRAPGGARRDKPAVGARGSGRLLLLCALLFTSPLALAQASPWHDWRTLSSEHFHIHFPAEMEEKARRAVAIAERVHARLAPAIGWQPQARTEIVLTDDVDFANGFASPLPYNHIYLFATPPDGIAPLADHDDWLELLITHEYTHTLHLDKATGFPRGARRVLGRHELLFPNLFQPLWMIEGLAVHHETDLERGIGRAQSTLFEMQMRMEVDAGIKPFDQVGMSGITPWPAGNTPYLYGAYFFRFVEEEYGSQAVRELVDHYSNNAIPFLLNRNLRQTLGSDGAELWAAFGDWLAQRFEPQLEAIRAGGVITGERVTEHGFRTAGADAVADDTVYYLRHDADHRPALMRWTPAGTERIARVRPRARIDADAEHGILVAQPEVCRNRQTHYDLYHIDPDSGRERRLTRCARYRDAAWAADGDHIIATRGERGEARIDRLAADGGFVETIWAGDGGAFPGRIDVSPDGETLALALWRPNRGWSLEALDLATGGMDTLTDDATIEGDPAFTPDGSALLFSSEHGGVYNIRRLDLASGEIRTLTHVVGGAFAPSQASADGPLYYIGYHDGGHDLYRLQAPLVERALPTDDAGNRLQPPPEPEPAAGTARPYRPWGTLRPRSWAPLVALSEAVAEIGVSTGGTDVLRNHAYSVTAGRELNEGLNWGGVSYRFADRLQLFAFRSFDYDTRSTDDDSDNDREIERATANDALQAQLALPVIRFERTLAAHLGGGITREHDRFVADGVDPDEDETSGVAGLAVTFNNSERTARAISRNRGRQIRLIGESNAAFGSDFSGEVYTLDWREFLPLGGHHVLALRGVQGWGTERPREFRLGRAAASDLMGAGALFDRRRYALRGYPETFRGSRMRLVSGEWRFPLYRLERSFTRFPIGLHQLSGRIIGESGATWDTGGSPETMRDSVGAELVGDFNAFYLLNFRARLGVAEGLDEGGDTEGYLLLENVF